jgi:peptide/nickel transport system substrate-binding protein
MAQLEAGSLDVVDLPPIQDTVRLRQDPAYQVIVNNFTGTFWCVLPNCKRTPTDNKWVRQALNYALDRQRIASTIWQGLAIAETLPWSPSSPAYDPVGASAYGFDLDRASALLARAGVTNAQLDITFSAATPDHATVAQMYQADLAKIGVATTLTPADPAHFVSELQTVGYDGLMISGGLNGHLLPGALILGPYYGPRVNYSGFGDDAYDALSSEVLAATDATRQHALYAQLNNYYLDQSWVLPVSQDPPHLIAQARVRGLRYDGREAIPLQDLWLAPQERGAS